MGELKTDKAGPGEAWCGRAGLGWAGYGLLTEQLRLGRASSGQVGSGEAWCGRMWQGVSSFGFFILE